MKPIIKYLLLMTLFAGFISCNQQSVRIQQLQNRIDSLKQKLSEIYRPGFGEFMSGIQAHLSKLWFAGLNENWDLARFEIDEIKESLDDIRKYETDRKESQLLPMINPALDSISGSVEKKDLKSFKYNFVYLTNTCNACNTAAEHKFNVVRIPESSPFINQDSKIH
jgi:hypothetical protein